LEFRRVLFRSTVLVREIELAQGDDDNRSAGANPAGEREFFGTVEAMNGNVWTISGQQVVVTATTEIKNTIVVGSLVKVHATPQADGTPLAREIELARGEAEEAATGARSPAGARDMAGVAAGTTRHA